MKQTLLIATLFYLLNSPQTWAITTGIQGHTRGDVIALTTDDEVAHLCNFTLQIVVTENHVLCVYNGALMKSNEDTY
jgi:hypothetical protein